MRRALIALGAAAAGFGVAAAPAQADTVVIAGTDALVWEPSLVDIKPGDTVTWTFAGTTQYHNVWSASPNWSVQSPGGVPAPDFSYTFEAEGTYDFYCQVHPDTMRGTVRVAAAPPPPPPPPPPSAQPFGNDAGEPLTIESNVKLDKTRPRLSRLSARRAGKRAARVRFRVSEQSDVTVRFKRGKRTIKTAETSADGVGTIRVRGLRPGSYRILVRATDLAGNRAKSRTLHLNLR